MSQPDGTFLVVGEILKPWGFRGEIKVKLITDYPQRFIKHKTLYVGDPPRALNVERARLHGNAAVVKFVGLEDENSVAKMRGELVRIAATDAAQLKPGQYYHYQIIGLNVVTTDGESLGVVGEILETGANDIYLVRTPEGKEILIPAIADVIKNIDLDSKTLTVSLLPGLVE